MASDHTHIADLLSAGGVPVTVGTDRDHLVLSVGGLRATFGLGQEDGFARALMDGWRAAKAWAGDQEEIYEADGGDTHAGPQCGCPPDLRCFDCATDEELAAAIPPRLVQRLATDG